jgi:hypothetical protein
MTEQMRKAPTINDLYRGQKSMGDEIGDVLKSFRETIRGGLQKGKERQESKGSTMYAKGGNVKRMRYGGEPDSSMDMGPPMRGMAPTPAPRGGPMPAMGPDPRVLPAKMTKGKLRYGSDFERPTNPDRVKDTSVTKMPIGEFEEGKGYGNRGSRPQLPPMPIEAPLRAEPKVPPPPIEPPPPKGLYGPSPMTKTATATSAPPPTIEPSSPKEPPARDVPMGSPRNPHNPYMKTDMKTGGTVKKMAQGGYAKADGAASRGKTQPKMVKMAKGGFVKTADGCAQRGKTKAFQVKMKRGGMC